MSSSTQERLFCAIEVPLVPPVDEASGSFAALLESRKTVGRPSGWVPLLHITLYFFQHDSKQPGDPVWSRDYITKRLQTPEFDAKAFELNLSQIITCGTRTLRLKVEDPSSGLQYLHHRIVELLGLPPLPGGWEGGHVSLYRFNTAETKALESQDLENSVAWVTNLISAYSNINYTFKVSDFKLYLSQRSGYIPVANFALG